MNKDNSHSWVRISHGLNKLVTNLNKNEQETSEMKFEECALRLNAGDFASRSKAKATRFCRLIHKNYTYGKQLGPMLNQESIQSPIMKCRRNWFVFYVMEVYLETTMERLNSGEKKTIFRLISCVVIIGLIISGRAAWQEEEETRKYFSIVLIHQEQSCTSKLFKNIQDAVSLILPYRTMSLFRTVYSSTFIISDVQTIYSPSSIQDWYREVKIWAIDKPHSFCLWIQWTKTTRILTRSTWNHRVLHITCTKHGRNIKIRCIGSTSTLLRRKDWSSITRSNAIILYETLPAYCIPKVVRMETGEVIYEKVYESPRPPPKIWNMTGWKNWVQKLFDNQREKSKSSPSNQPNPNPDHDRTEKPVVCPQRGASRSKEIETRSFREEAVKHDRTEKPVVCRDENHEHPTVVCSEQTTHPRFSREGQNGETRCLPWSKSRAINVKRGWHRLQNTRIATFWCETIWQLSCSGTREEDREPPSPAISLTRFTTKQSLQPV